MRQVCSDKLLNLIRQFVPGLMTFAGHDKGLRFDEAITVIMADDRALDYRVML